MKTKKQDAKRPLPRSSTPRTDEAHERWAQGKVNWIDEMAKLELELYELRDRRNARQCSEGPTFSYWLDIIEHTCDSTEPIGSCLRCDMQHMQEELLEQCRLLGMSGEREIDLRSRIRSLEDQLDCAMWCLERADKRASDWQDCARRLVENGMPNSWESRVEWDKAKSYHKHMSKVQPHNL